MERNYVTVTLCIVIITLTSFNCSKTVKFKYVKFLRVSYNGSKVYAGSTLSGLNY